MQAVPTAETASSGAPKRGRTSLHMDVDHAVWLDKTAKRLAHEMGSITKADVIDLCMAVARARWPEIEAELKRLRSES